RPTAGRRTPLGPTGRRATCPAWRPPGGAGTRRAASCTGPAPTRSSCPQNSASAAFPPAGAAKTPYRPAADFHIVTTVETPTTPAALELRRREVLRQASVALAGRTVASWEVSPSAEVVPILASAAAPRLAHEVANPLPAALAALELARGLVRDADSGGPAFRAALLDELAGVGDGMDQAIQFLRSIQDRARGTLARSERFDAAQVVRSCV